MKNVKVEVDGNILRLEVDLTKEFGLSSSGKTTIIASSEGNQNVEGFDGFKFGINVYKKG